MNILVFSWRDPKHPLAGGAEQVMHEHMKGWVEDGNKVTLFSSKVKELSLTDNIDGIKVIRRGYQYLGVQIEAFRYYLKNKDKYDFVVDQFHGVPFFTPIYSDKPKLAVIQEPAKNVWFKNPLPLPLNYLIGFLGYIFEPLFFIFYKKTKFMTGSKSAKKDVSRYGIPPENITIVSHGVIKPKYRMQNTKYRNAITYLGMISKDKGIEDALEAFKILSKDTNFVFWVIGKPESKEYFNILKNKKRVKFWGRVDEKTKFELLSKSLFLINPSVHEGWGLVNIEANSVGTPVVAYKNAGLIDSVKNGFSGYIVNKNKPEELSKMIENGLRDKDRYKRLRESSVSWSNKFKWSSSRKKSLELLNKIYSCNHSN